jgi:hypothetical protein
MIAKSKTPKPLTKRQKTKIDIDLAKTGGKPWDTYKPGTPEYDAFMKKIKRTGK